MNELLFFKIGKAHFKIDIDEIQYLQAEKRNITVVTTTKSYDAIHSITDLEKILPASLFRRVHRSYIVSLRHIDKFDHELIYIGKKKIPIASHYRNVLKAAITVITGKQDPIRFDNGRVDKLIKDINA